MTTAHTRSASTPASRPSPAPSAIAAEWLQRAERTVRTHRQELLVLAATVAFVVLVALIGVAAVSS